MTAAQQRQARRPPRRRRAVRQAPALLAALAAAVLAVALVAAPAAAQVLPMDKQALLEFKAGLTEQGGELLLSWVPESDPCDGWTGVRCTCTDFFADPEDTARAKVPICGWQHAQLLSGYCRLAGCWAAELALLCAFRSPAAAGFVVAAASAQGFVGAALLVALHADAAACSHPSHLPRAHRPVLQVCQQPDTIPDGSRVLQLNFGDPQITEVRVHTAVVVGVAGVLVITCWLSLLRVRLSASARLGDAAGGVWAHLLTGCRPCASCCSGTS